MVSKDGPAGRRGRPPGLKPARLPPPRTILGGFYTARLSVAAAIFLAALYVWDDAGAATTLSASLILFVSAGFTAVSFWYTHLLGRPVGRALTYLQACFDLGLVTWIVYLTGGNGSVFAPLYILVICGAAVLLPMLGGILVGVLASVLYFGAVALHPLSELDAAVVLQLLLFTAVALVTGYLGDRLRQTGTVLGEIETELRLLRLDTDDVLGSINTGILTVDGEGRLVYINPAATELLDLPPHQWLGHPILERLESVAAGLGEVIRRSAETRRPIRRFETDHAEEGEMVLGVSTTLLERSEAEAPTVTAIFQDITERKRMEALRRRAERLEAVAELSASLAHEIKNPLASIRSAVEQLTGGGIDREDKQVLEGLVLRESDRLSRLLAEFLDFARVRVQDAVRVELGPVLKESVELLRAHPDAEGRRITVRGVREGGPSVRGDADLLHRAFFNLVLNAAQWAGPGGKVDVTIDTVSSDILSPEVGVSRLTRIRVRDSGPGVPPEAQELIFNPFFTSRPGGTGLGLALVQRAMEAHGGAVLVESGRGPGGTGAVFAVYLPTPREEGPEHEQGGRDG